MILPSWLVVVSDLEIRIKGFEVDALKEPFEEGGRANAEREQADGSGLFWYSRCSHVPFPPERCVVRALVRVQPGGGPLIGLEHQGRLSLFSWLQIPNPVGVLLDHRHQGILLPAAYSA